MSDQALHIVLALLGTLTFLGTLATALIAVGKIQGTVGRRLDGHDDDIGELKDVDNKQWEHIGDQREAIAKIKGHLGLNGG